MRREQTRVERDEEEKVRARGREKLSLSIVEIKTRQTKSNTDLLDKKIVGVAGVNEFTNEQQTKTQTLLTIKW